MKDRVSMNKNKGNKKFQSFWSQTKENYQTRMKVMNIEDIETSQDYLRELENHRNSILVNGPIFQGVDYYWDSAQNRNMIPLECDEQNKTNDATIYVKND